MSAPNYHPVVCFGETLWHVLPTGRQAAGAPVNIAYHLQKLGMNPALISRIGFDDLGRELIETLEAKHICTDYFQMDEEKPTGVATAYIKEGYEAIYTIYNDVAWDGIEYTDELAKLVSGADYFVFGSLAARCEVTYETLLKLLSLAKTRVFHIHLCAPFYNCNVIETLLKQTDILTLTLAELELVTGWFSLYKQDTDRIRVLQERFGIPVIAVTGGRKGPVISMDNFFYEHPGFAARQSGGFGSREAFLAGLIAKLSHGDGAGEILKYAAAAAMLIESYEEPYPDYKVEEIDELLHIKIT